MSKRAPFYLSLFNNFVMYDMIVFYWKYVLIEAIYVSWCCHVLIGFSRLLFYLCFLLNLLVLVHGQTQEIFPNNVEHVKFDKQLLLETNTWCSSLFQRITGMANQMAWDVGYLPCSSCICLHKINIYTLWKIFFFFYSIKFYNFSPKLKK